jgi:hypothetical protein
MFNAARAPLASTVPSSANRAGLAMTELAVELLETQPPVWAVCGKAFR